MPVVPLIAAWLAAVSMVVALLLAPTAANATPMTGSAERTSAGTVSGPDARTADLSTFQPGNIISDAVFFDSGTMTAAQIQAFLDDKVPSCRSGYTCLKDWYDTSRATSADAMCGAYAGGYRERASQIIYKVAKACGINPQVILATLQKEQGLVNHVWPSDWRYTIAMGQGCPDTAACDERYYGFFNQVYGAAWQFKRYANPSGTSQYFTWYAPGKTWNVLYHPNRDCGSSPVYIQNQATANLYYYTPYQPNAAALRAGYGEGDGCSSYGNRNFFQYFTDWFGSTRSASRALVKVGPHVWITSGSRAYHVTAEAYSEYKRVFGAPLVVDQSYLATYENSGRASYFVRNTRTGVVSYLEGGQSHRFDSCSLVAAWGGACGDALVQLQPREFDRFGTGAEMTRFARLTADGRIHEMRGEELQPLFNVDSAARLNAGRTPYVATLPETGVANYRVLDRVRFGPGQFLVPEGSPHVYLAMSDGRLLHLPSWQHAAELGLPASVTARPTWASLDGYRQDGELSVFPTCATTAYFASAGTLHALSAGVPAGFDTAVLDSDTCAWLTRNGATVSGALFTKVAGTSPVYHLVDGVARHVATGAQLREINGGSAPTIVSQPTESAKIIPVGAPYRAPGSLVRAQGTAEVWLVDHDRLLHLPTWEMAQAAGLPLRAGVVEATQLEPYGRAGALTHFVSCGGDIYSAAGGHYSRVASEDSGGNAVTPLAASTCAAIDLSGDVIEGAVLLTDGARTVVAAAGGFLRLPDPAAILRASGGIESDSRLVSAGYLAALPQPTELPGDGDVVRSSDSRDVTVVDGTSRVRVPNWGVVADLGLTGRYSVVSPAEVATLPQRGGTLQVFVVCGGTPYVAGGGVLSPVTADALAGLETEALSEALCATLDRSGAPISGQVFVRAADRDAVYVVDRGSLRQLGEDDDLASMNGGAVPRIILLDGRTIAGLPQT